MKYNEAKEPIGEEEKEIIARGFGNKMYPIHLRHSALQERMNEIHTEGAINVLGNNVGNTGKITILGNQLKREQKGILKKI